MKLIFVTGWTVSGLWKWISTASIAKLLQNSWLNIWVVKMDPYLQVDAGTMSPYEHWEVFVTKDGWETDLDLWNYERFLWKSLSKQSNITTWKVYQNVINKERAWEYLWQTVQIIPHITNEIKDNISLVAKEHDITIIEVWWTVWDIESLPFLEAIRQFKRDLWQENVFYVHVALLLKLDFSWEIKTKPIQHTIVKLREYWIQSNMLICRTSEDISSKLIDKISMLCDIDSENIIEWRDVSTIYEVPKKLKDQDVDKKILKYFWYKDNISKMDDWNELVSWISNPIKNITIWIVWKYTEFQDTYKSITEAIIHAWARNAIKVNINWIDSELLQNDSYESKLKRFVEEEKLNAILIPGWFGPRWIEWMINAVTFARKFNVPFLWICLWMQVAVIEYARNVCKLKKAGSSEFENKLESKVIDIMNDQKNIKNKWWTMRLWAYDAILKKWSLASKLYGTTNISERHRHRYEVNPDYHSTLEKWWLVLSWKSPDDKLVEFIELENHPYFIATQAHPEFKSSLENPHPLFLWLIKAAIQFEK